MASYSTSANIVLTVNGKQAGNMLTKLERDAKRLQNQIENAGKAGDKASMKKFQKELNNTNKLMEQLRGKTSTTEQVLKNLDAASPRQLNKTLRQLQQELNGIQRGSAAWDAHVAKIKAVKMELQRVNSSLVTQKSMWSKFNGWLNTCQTALLGVTAAVTGLILAGRKAVASYAEMEESLANTRKFTGMSEEGVAALNKEFKSMDTRTAREQLNLLAQEAGRLGKTTQEDVLGYVKAADIINVALSDLGEGATQKIAKLSNIFKIEDQYGTYDSMVKIGSVVNVLSQNCTASKPYLVEFANRLAGVGSQAGITLQNIIGLGAVLDANAQKVESSATAIGQVLVRMYRDPQKYAKVAGMDVQEFTQLLKTDANEALLQFLEKLKEAGNMDVLSPMFKDMGENGARVITALSTLSGHIDEVRWQQENANRAFNEGTSVLKEYNIFNNTAQASIDKAKKRVQELAIELGEKLYPLMKHIYTSSSVMLRVLNQLVSFFIEYKREILVLCAAIASYIAVAKAQIVVNKGLNLVMATGTAIAKAARVTVMALRIGYLQLTNQVSKADTMMKMFNKTSKASPWGIIIALVAAAVGAIWSFYERAKGAREEAERLRKELEEWGKSLKDINSASADYSSKEITRLKSLYEEATNEATAKDKRRKAAEKLQEIYPDYFKNMSTEEIMLGNAKDAYNKLRDSIIEVAKARAASDKIFENERGLLELEIELPELKKKEDNARALYDKAVADLASARELESNKSYSNSTDAAVSFGTSTAPYASKVAAAGNDLYEAQKAVKENLEKQKKYVEANESLKKRYQITAKELNNSLEENEVSGYGGTQGDEKLGENKDRFAAEEEWRKKAEAQARIDYAIGKTDYIAYTNEMNAIAEEFYKKQLEHEDLTDTERLEISANYLEAKKKRENQYYKDTIQDENNSYRQRKQFLETALAEGQISQQTYDIKLEELELSHQQTLFNITKREADKLRKAEADSYNTQLQNIRQKLNEKKLTEEQANQEIEQLNRTHNRRLIEIGKDELDQEATLNNLKLNSRKKRQQELAENEKKFASMKNEFFGDNPQEAQTKLNADLAALDIVYQRELAAAGDNAQEKLRIEEAYENAKLVLKKKYGQLGEAEEMGAVKRGIMKASEWLKSDGGQALQGTISTLTNGMSSIFSSLSTMIQAELEIQTASINKRYDTEITKAEGNTYKVAKLEKEKQKEIAKAKNEANKKMFAMQVIQAVAQTAQNAISAYGSAAAIPLVGHILAPIAAAMAVAAGMLQIAAIKKQQQASEAQGYAEGGFTPSGEKYKEVGVVHAGEWVASQKLVNDPRTRPIINALEYAQRNNSIGSITPADVSKSVTAPAILAARTGNQSGSNQPQAPVIIKQNDEYAATMKQLADRLEQPFVTVNTVAGDAGIKKAQDEYDTLIRNKSPKSKK